MQQIWNYPDATGTIQHGIMLGYSDLGGTDITYKFHRLNDAGEPIVYDGGGRCVDMVSGERLKRACNVTASYQPRKSA